MLFVLSLDGANAAGNHVAGNLESLNSAIAAYQSRHACPPPGLYSVDVYEIYCKPYCDRALVCRGNKETDPCYKDSTSAACREQEQGSQLCLQEMNRRNEVVNGYNRIVNACHESEWSRKMAAARQKAAGADQVARAQRDEMLSEEKSVVARVARQTLTRELAECDSQRAASARRCGTFGQNYGGNAARTCFLIADTARESCEAVARGDDGRWKELERRRDELDDALDREVRRQDQDTVDREAAQQSSGPSYQVPVAPPPRYQSPAAGNSASPPVQQSRPLVQAAPYVPPPPPRVVPSHGTSNCRYVSCSVGN
jgi:hypothetical protein